MGYTGQTPTAVPLTSADIVDGTITNDDLAGSIADAKISALSASKLTGSLPASMATDTSTLESRLKTAELRIAGLNDAGINNSEGSFADAYTNETGVDTGASTNEFYSSANNSYSNLNIGATSYSNLGGTGDRSGIITVTSDLSGISGNVSNLVDGSQTVSSSTAMHIPTSINITGNHITFQFANAVLIDEAIWKRNVGNGIGTWKWQGSSDGSSYTDIGTSFALGTSTSQTLTQLNGNTSTYTYYRLLGVSGNPSGANWDTEIEFKISTGTTSDMTLISNTVTAETEPTTVEVLLVNEPVDTVAINTDLTMEVSIDGGANYDAVTLVDKGLFATGQNLLRGSADVTARTGTSIKYRLKTLNTKEQKQVGVVLAWSN